MEQKIRLNLIPTGPMPVCYASQYDKKREIGLVLFNGTRPLLFTDETLELDVRKSDSHIVTIDVPTPEGTNLAVFETTEQMCAVAGSNECELRIKKAGADIGSLNFIMEIERSPMENGLQSDSEIRNLATQIAAAATPVVEEIAPPIIRDFLADDYYNKEATDELIQTIAANFAGEYNEEDTYYNGAFVIYENALYRCQAGETSGEFDPEDWYLTNITAEMKEDLQELEGILRALISNKMDKTNPTGSGSFSFNRRAGSTIGEKSVAFAENSVASGNNSFTAGYGHVATNYGAFAEGSGNEARGNCSHAEGRGTKSTNNNTHAEGGYTTASGGTSHAEGWETTASGVCSHSEGDTTTASGSNAHAEGGQTTASGNSSHSEGYNTTASGYVSHAEGYATEASATESHAEGYGTKASRQGAHAEGEFTKASGSFSHAEGSYTEATHKDQHVFGEYNILDDSQAEASRRGNYVEIVGNGTGSNNRSNARTLDWQGNETIAGDLIFNGSTSLTDEIDRLDDKIDDLPEPMVFKGTLGVGGTIQNLPAAGASNEGYTYKVITEGTYAGQAAKIGDTFTCGKPEGSSLFTWVLFSQGDTDTDTWRGIKVNGTEKIGSGISTGDVDFVDSDTIEWEYDSNGNKIKPKTKNIYTEAEVNELVEEAIYDILPSDTESGSIANFETDLALPLKSAIFDVNAIQDLHGQSGAYPAGGGKNLFDVDNAPVLTGYIGSQTFNSNNSAARTTYVKISPSTTYTVQKILSERFVIATAEAIPADGVAFTSRIQNDTRQSLTITSGANDAYLWIFCYLGTVDTKTLQEILNSIQVEVGSTATAWAPYSNICPISGRSEAEVGKSNGRSDLAPFLRGLLQGKYAFVEMNSLIWTYSTYADVNYFVTSTSLPNVKAPAASGQTANAISNGYTNVASNGVTSPIFVSGTMFIWTTGRLFLRDTSYTDVTTFVNSLQGKYLIYELATPETPTITQAQFEMLCEAFGTSGEFTTIELGGTYYGGRILQDKEGHRQLDVTHEILDLGEPSWSYSTWGAGPVFSVYLPLAKEQPTAGEKGDIKCTIYKNITSSEMYNDNPKYSICLNRSNVRISNPDYTDRETFKTAMAGQKLVYELATPITIDLPDGEPITTAIGTNNIYADSGDTTVEFKESINKKIASLQALILNT